MGGIESAGLGSGDGFNAECPELTSSGGCGGGNRLRGPKGQRELC